MPGEKQAEAKMTEEQEQHTGMHTEINDVVYDLVGVAYHTLQNATSCSIYASDAQLVGEQQIAHFFWQKQQGENDAADAAEQLLSRLLGGEEAVQEQARVQAPSQFFGRSYQGQFGSGFASPLQGGQGSYPARLANFPQQATGTRNVTYDLVSLLYHSLEVAHICETSIQDVRKAGGGYQDIVQFYQRLQREEDDAANRAKQWLGPRLSGGDPVDPAHGPQDGGAEEGQGNEEGESEPISQPFVSGGEPQSAEFPQYQAGGYPDGLSQNWQYEGGTVAGGVGQPGTQQGGFGPGGSQTGGTVAAGLGIGPDLNAGTDTGGTGIGAGQETSGTGAGPEAPPEENP